MNISQAPDSQLTVKKPAAQRFDSLRMPVGEPPHELFRGSVWVCPDVYCCGVVPYNGQNSLQALFEDAGRDFSIRISSSSCLSLEDEWNYEGIPLRKTG
jgi:hypothetical protein